MEECASVQNHTGAGSGGPGPVQNVNLIKNNHDEKQRVQYSIPGILHFIQHEWARFEMERSQWEVEKAEMQARIAFLQGERKGQENLKNDLVRRIKMLEYALKQERAKYHKLKYGTELNQGEVKPPFFEDPRDENLDGDNVLGTNSNVTWRQGRQLLRQYLQEIGYTDTIIDVRSARVRSLLGLAQSNADNEENHNALPSVNGEQVGKRASESQGRRTTVKKAPISLAEGTLIDSEASVLETLDFLASENVDMDEDDGNLSDEMEEGSADEEADERLEAKRIKSPVSGRMFGVESSDYNLTDAETEEVLSEFYFLGSESGDGAGEARSQNEGGHWDKRDEYGPSDDWRMDQQLLTQLKDQYRKERNVTKGSSSQRPKRSALQAMLASLSNEDESCPESPNAAGSPVEFTPVDGPDKLPCYNALQGSPYAPPGIRRPLLGGPGNDDDALEAALGLGLGDLAAITVSNESEGGYDVAASKEAYRKTWTAKYTLRSHFDGVRALAFHPVEPVLITASEDHTLKLWNLQKTVPAKKTASLDVEPVYTFRAHEGPVLCLAMSATGEQCFSGGVDAAIHCWNIPSSNVDPYDSFDPGVLTSTLKAHRGAVWGLSIHASKLQLLSCSSDGTVCLWAPPSKIPLLNTYTCDASDGVPTSVDFVRCDSTQMVTAFTSSNTVIYDLETGKPVVRFESNQNPDSGAALKQVNRVVSHPTLPLTVTAHEDRHIRFFDNLTGKMVHSMVAHLDAVTCLAVDPNGLYLLSGSHDCSIRLWNLDNKTCVQEITSHRKKFDEAIFDVAFHPSKPYIASAGADALAKVFV